ncbi:signal recognition particle 14 kDa protein-like [Acyrthosiphon pisum]|uniref:Signal recognition particle 14 kDa protein n=1 Tax=Acyrthosiphon pisum TaxID=7029 RepID=C4WTQ2_ACYPI|nr:signal recognition particle 14 kDa protein-like [Acyrthosiphon pisum]BAH71272.1 ACYPI000835 [Acyrthosiphon pisum]|eukprot:NP_001156068.1 signal recognition particle 14 kDa protein-like [Acyrthosiphon pisum]
MVLLEKAKFLEELNILFNTSQSSGSVRITMKLLLLSKKDSKDQKLKIEVPKEKVCLIRATFKNKKLSTRITADEVSSFQEEYCTLLKNSLSSLKKTKKLKKKAMS